MAPFGDDLSWGLNLYGKLTISGTGAMPDFSSMKETPWYADRSLITEVVLENGVTTVGDFAFSGCSNLGKVTLPEGVTKIGFCGFSSCGNLPEIILPQTLTSLGKQAFYGCSALASITFGEGATLATVGTYAFSGCDSLKLVIFHSASAVAGLLDYDAYGFLLTAVETVVLPAAITDIPAYITDVYTCIDTLMLDGAALSTKLTASSGYKISSVKVTMGGVDITANVYTASNGLVRIPAITGNVVITAE
jgi:hypothetical protein